MELGRFQIVQTLGKVNVIQFLDRFELDHQAFLHKKIGDIVKKGQPLFTIYSEHESKIDDALKTAEQHDAYKIERPVLGVVKLGS